MKPRHSYEVTDISLEPEQDRPQVTILIDTAGPIDLALELDRATLEQLRLQCEHVLSEGSR